MSRYKILPILSFLMLLVFNTANAQCVSGDCDNGFGTWKWANGTIYKGEFQNGARGGYGYYLFENGDVYVGEWQNNERHGYGVYYFSNHSSYKRYSGEWRANQRSGMGILHFNDDKIAARFGVWENGKYKHKYEDLECLEGDCYNGFGVYVWNDGSRYEGNFVEGKRNGEGVYYYSKGSKYVGTQENDRRHGWGTYYYASGSKYVGEWVYETKEGRGTFYSKGQIAEKCIYVAGKCSQRQESTLASSDKKPPVISIIHPEVIALRNGGPRVVVKQKTIHVEGKASDESGIEQVRTSGAISELSLLDKKTTRFVGKVSLAVGQNTFWVEATDKAGNTIKEEFQIIYQPDDLAIINEPTSRDNGTSTKPKVKKISEKRTALVIGNASYAHVPALRNPKNDAIAIAAELQKMDFEVELRTDASEEEMIVAIREFGARLKQNGGVGLFYYAGHGLQLNGENYLVPVDADIHKSGDIELESVRLKRALNELEFAANRMNIVILDACRDNPYPEVRSVAGPGLSQTNAPQGTYIAYSTSPGKAASDGSGEHGLYTEMLLRALQESEGKTIENVFKTVRQYVLDSSEGLQVPWENSSITGDFYFKY